jgi:hypothetical protein
MPDKNYTFVPDLLQQVGQMQNLTMRSRTPRKNSLEPVRRIELSMLSCVFPS